MEKGEKHHIGKQAWNRLRACILIKDGELSVQAACKAVGISRSTFTKRGWLKQFEWSAWSVVDGDRRMGNNRKLTPNSKEFLVEEAAKKDGSAGAALHALKRKRLDMGDNRPGVHVSSVRRMLNSNGVVAKGQKKRRVMVKAPWHARYRKQFAEESLKRLRKDKHDGRKQIHSDEKKFCLWDNSRQGWVQTEEDGSVVASGNFAMGMTDDEYETWRDSRGNAGARLPKDKAKGLYPTFVWGALGYNFKSPLFIFNKGQRLTTELYKKILDKHLLPEARKWAREKRPGTKGRGQKPTFRFVQDNDPKHQSIHARTWLAEKKVELVKAERLDEDGQTDTFHHRGGPYKNKECWPSFPPYSPDLNGMVEKAWRCMDRRVLERAGEIHSRDDMVRVVKDEWHKLEFKKSTRDGWIGINNWADKWKGLNESVLACAGWDTPYMR